MNRFQQGWRENNPTTTLQDLKESVKMLNDPFGGMLDTEEEEVQDDYRDYINQEVEAINNK
jgi:hypothetical protein